MPFKVPSAAPGKMWSISYGRAQDSEISGKMPHERWQGVKKIQPARVMCPRGDETKGACGVQ
jgi:hypothetical protein